MPWYTDLRRLGFVTVSDDKTHPSVIPGGGAAGQPAYQCHTAHASCSGNRGVHECFRHAKKHWFHYWTDAEVVAFLDTLARTAPDLASSTDKGQKAVAAARMMRVSGGPRRRAGKGKSATRAQARLAAANTPVGRARAEHSAAVLQAWASARAARVARRAERDARQRAFDNALRKAEIARASRA